MKHRLERLTVLPAQDSTRTAISASKTDVVDRACAHIEYGEEVTNDVMAQADEVEDLSDNEQVDEMEDFSDPEQVDGVEDFSDPEQVDGVEDLSDPEQVDGVEDLSDPEQVDGVEDLSDPGWGRSF
eukprot:Em0069g2a